METNDTQMMNMDNGVCQCSRKLRLLGSFVTHKSAQLITFSSEDDENYLEEDAKLKDNGHDYESKVENTPWPSQGKENKRPQEVEEVICKMKVESKYSPMEDESWITVR